jgi:predicted neutral ceramidase superfamily lipid hydrolase
MRRPLLPGSGPLARVSPVLVFLAVAAVFAVAVVVGGPLGALLLALLAVGVAVLLATTWARLSPPERLARSLVLAVLVAVAIGVALR